MTKVILWQIALLHCFEVKEEEEKEKERKGKRGRKAKGEKLKL